MPVRRALDLLYRGSGALAATFLLGICAVVSLQVGCNLIDFFAGLLIGRPIGLVVPSYAEFAGYFLAASSFLALAPTLRAGGHIRVSLLIGRLAPRPRRRVELWCLAAGAALAGYFTWSSLRLVLESLEFGDVSPGMVPVPLWIPQAAVTLGLAVFTLALLDELVSVARGRPPGYLPAEEARHEPAAGGERG